MMTTQQVADRLVELCKQNDFVTAQKELYADDVISIEPEETPAFAKEIRGKENVLAKIEKFNSMIDKAHGNKVSEPLVSGSAIAFKLTMDVQMKEQQRAEMSEICVYEVKDGKVISERFFM